MSSMRNAVQWENVSGMSTSDLSAVWGVRAGETGAGEVDWEGGEVGWETQCDCIVVT